MEEEDDWNPQEFQYNSILQKQVVNFTDQVIQQNLAKIDDEIYDCRHVRKYAEDNWISDDEEEMMNDEQYKADYQKQKEQLMTEQIFYDPVADYQNERVKVINRYQIALTALSNYVMIIKNMRIIINIEHLIVMNTKINQNKLVKPNEDDNQLYFSVQCQNCDVEVAVYDVREKMYHFFNVIPGFG
ncbi:hypothetical protein pb186bvf_014764 [Paramecium bursaria]